MILPRLIVNFPFISSNIPASPAHAVYISQLMRYYKRACVQYSNSLDRTQLLTQMLLKQGYVAPKYLLAYSDVRYVLCCVYVLFLFSLFVCLHLVSCAWWCPTHIFFFYFVLFGFVLCLVHPMFQVSLRCPFLIAPSVSLEFINGINTFDGERMFKKIEKSVMISIQDDFCSMTLL